ncbi:hypothetical protein ACFWMH_27540 [Streptomyces tendae]|uniref:hypothetical protein n=1 Tax=Streptomyces tendae TaxID=1932 RepID=UPI0036542669
MSLITLPAFLTRRKETPVTTTTGNETTENSSPAPVMRFLTVGGAEVHVSERGRDERTTFSGTTYGFTVHGWKCHGCGRGSDYYDRSEDWEARDKANGHATKCRAMPKPGA